MRQRDFMKAFAALLALGSAIALAQPPAGAPPGGPAGGPPGGMMMTKTAAEMHYDVVLDVVDGKASPGNAAAGKLGGKPLAAGATGSATGLQVRSADPHVNGLYVHGHGPFTLADSRIELAGAGVSDFDGVAAGALVRDDATMVLRNVHITTNGIVSSAAVATDKSVMKVYHSTLVANGGPAPSAYVRRIGPGMMEPPTPLGIVGTARATLTMGEAKSYFYDSTLIADGWGALSTDAAHGAYLEANRCDIRVLRSGYGAYADNGASVVINDSKLNTATFLGIIAGQASMAFNNDHGVSAGNAVMIHSVMGQPGEFATLTIKDGTIASTNAAILVKSANANILIDGAKISARNGDLLLAENNDDSHATVVNGQKVPGVHATIRNTALVGNIVHIDSDRTMTVGFESASLKGFIRGATVSLDAGSRWYASADSQVSFTGAVDESHVDAPRGVTIKATGDAGLPHGDRALASGGTLSVD